MASLFLVDRSGMPRSAPRTPPKARLAATLVLALAFVLPHTWFAGTAQAQLPEREERTNVIWTGSQLVRVYDPTVDAWIDLQTTEPVVSVVTGNLRVDALPAPPNFRDQPDSMSLNNGVMVATDHQIHFYDPTSHRFVSRDLPAGQTYAGAAVPDRQGEVLALAYSDNTAWVYSAARNDWIESPPLPETLAANLSWASAHGAMAAGSQKALFFDRTRDAWVEVPVPAGQTIGATGIPAMPEPGLTSVVITQNYALAYDQVKGEWVQYQSSQTIRQFAIAEQSIVVATDNGIAFFDPVTDQWAEKQLGPNAAVPVGGVLASRNTALAVTGEAGFIYNRSRHQIEEIRPPANEAFSGLAIAENTALVWTEEGTAFVYDVNRQEFVEGQAPPNAQIVGGTMNQNLGLVTTTEGVLVYDPGTNQWTAIAMPPGDMPVPPGAPNFSVSRFTTLITTNNRAYVWNQGTHQLDEVAVDGDIRTWATSENSAVVATDNSVYVYDPTLNQYVPVKPSSPNETIQGLDTARNTAVARTPDRAWFYNRSTHEWVEIPAPANETWNVQLALENTALVCSETQAAVWDPTRDEWVTLSAGSGAQALRDGNSFMVVTDSKAFVYNRSRHEWQETELPPGGTGQGGGRRPIPCQPRAGGAGPAGEQVPPDEGAEVDPPPDDPDSSGVGEPPAGTAAVTRSVVLVLDASGSMSDNNKMEDAKAAAKELLAYVPADTQVGLLIYYDCASLDWHPFTQDVAGLQAVVDGVQASGGTPLFMSIGMAYDHMEKSGSERGDIIVLTDGGESCQDDPDRNREAAESFSTRRIPWIRRVQEPSSSMWPGPSGFLASRPTGDGGMTARLMDGRGWGALLGPATAYAQEAPGTIRLHLVGFQVTPEDDARLQELASLAKGQYHPATDLAQLKQALHTAAGTSAGGGTGGGTGLIVGIGLAVLAAAMLLLVLQAGRGRRFASAGGTGQLLVTRGQASRAAVPLNRPVIRIGRDPGNDLVVSDSQASRRHAEIRWQGGSAVVHDLGSVNGTFVNGERIGGPRLVQPGDVIRIGGAEMQYNQAPAGRAPSGGAHLVLLHGLSQPSTLALGRKAAVSLGRDRSNDVVVSGDAQVSRAHARIQHAQQGYWIEDLGSENGVYVNDQRVPHAWLKAGDRIRLGKTEFTFQG